MIMMISCGLVIPEDPYRFTVSVAHVQSLLQYYQSPRFCIYLQQSGVPVIISYNYLHLNV
jgi:hypothetical protein